MHDFFKIEPTIPYALLLDPEIVSFALWKKESEELK